MILDYVGLNKIILEDTRLHRTIQDYTGTNKTISDNIGLYRNM